MLCLLLGAAGGADVHAADDYLTQVMHAARSADWEALEALARVPVRDPWLVVDRVTEERLDEAAQRYTAAVVSPTGAALRAYAARFPLGDERMRARVDRAAAHITNKAWKQALSALGGEAPPGPTVTSVRWFVNLARAQGEELGSDRALATYDRAVREAQTLGWLRGEDIAWHGRFWILRREHRYLDALMAVDERRRIAGSLDDSRLRAFVDHDQAALHLDLGEAWTAVPPLERALAWFAQHGPRRTEGETRALLGLAHGKTGHFARALTAIQEATRIAAEVRDTERYVDALHTTSGIYVDMGFYERAIAIVNMLLANQGLESDSRGQLLANRAMANAYLGKTKAAAEDFEQALSTAPADDGDPWRRWFRMMRSLTLHDPQGAWGPAAADARAAVDDGIEIEETNGWARLALGSSLLGQREPALALAELTRALHVAQELDILDLRMTVRGRIAEAALASGDPQEAIRWSRDAVADLDLVAAGLADDEGVALRADFERARLFRTWRTAARALPSKERPGAIFEALEVGRARLLLAAIGGTHQARGLDLSDELRDRERRAQRELLLTRESYQRARRRPQRAPRDAAYKRMLAARDRWQETVSSIQRLSGARASLAYPRAPDLGAVREALGPKDAIAIFDGEGSRGSALVITRSKAVIRPLESWPGARAAVQRILARDELDGPASYTKDVATLRATLLDPLGLPAATESLHVVPAEFLTGVPWPRVAPAKLAITLVPSAMTWLALKERAPATDGKRLLAGDPLYEKDVGGRTVPWSDTGGFLDRLEHSATELRPMRRDGDTLLLRRDATETRVKELLSQEVDWDLIHLACHGLVNRGTPSLTSLALSPSDEDDGFLTATEAFALRTRARLVVLSACNVGQATYADGVGVLGLVRAFLAAGSTRIIASVWPADDEATGVLMKRVHDLRAGGTGLDAALRKAQAQIRDHVDDEGRRPWADPYYWAGWVVWGGSARP